MTKKLLHQNKKIANREEPDQTASEEAVWSGSVLIVYTFFWQAMLWVFKIFKHLPLELG